MPTNCCESDEIEGSDRVYAVSAAVVLRGDPVWGQAVVHLHDEEFSGLCPACGGELFFEISSTGFAVRKDYDAGKKAIFGRIFPADPADLSGFGRWLYEVFHDAGDAFQTEQVRHLFGLATCPRCGAGIRVADAVEKFERNSGVA